MGLSSSQGRLLMLTSRMSDIELSETMISQRQNRLAWDSEKVAREYNEAMSNYKITIKLPDQSTNVGYSEKDITYQNMTSMGYLLTDAQNQIYLEKDENGNWIPPKNLNGQDILTVNQSTGRATIGDKTYKILDGTNFAQKPELLQNSLINGTVFVYDMNKGKSGISMSMLENETEMQYVLDTSDDAEAQSKYEYETARISRQDNQLDMELNQLETQHEAVLKEYDSVKEVISNNVDRTYKLFSNG